MDHEFACFAASYPLEHLLQASQDTILKFGRPKFTKDPISVVAIHCETVYSGTEPIVCKVSVVDFYGVELFNKIVQPTTVVTDFRTSETGLSPLVYSEARFSGGSVPFKIAQHRIEKLVARKTVVCLDSRPVDLLNLDLVPVITRKLPNGPQPPKNCLDKARYAMFCYRYSEID